MHSSRGTVIGRHQCPFRYYVQKIRQQGVDRAQQNMLINSILEYADTIVSSGAARRYAGRSLSYPLSMPVSRMAHENKH